MSVSDKRFSEATVPSQVHIQELGGLPLVAYMSGQDSLSPTVRSGSNGQPGSRGSTGAQVAASVGDGSKWPRVTDAPFLQRSHSVCLSLSLYCTVLYSIVLLSKDILSVPTSNSLF